MRKDNRLWFQRMRISAEILSNVWKEDNARKVGEVNESALYVWRLLVQSVCEKRVRR